MCRCALSLCLCLSLSVYLSVHVSRHVSSLSVSVCLPLSNMCVRASSRDFSLSASDCVQIFLLHHRPPWQVLLRHGARSEDTDDEGRSAEAYAPRYVSSSSYGMLVSSSFTDTARKRTLQGRPHSCTRGGYICMYPPPLLTQAYAPREGTQLRALACILLLY